MSPRFRPPGRTFKERWPQEAEETRYFAATTYAVVVGGVLGVVLVPVLIWEVFSRDPAAIVVPLGLLVVVTFAIGLVGSAPRRWLTLVWKISAWILGAAAVGLAFESVTFAICDGSCISAAAPGRTPSGLLIVYALQVVGSVGVAVLVALVIVLRHRPQN